MSISCVWKVARPNLWSLSPSVTHLPSIARTLRCDAICQHLREPVGREKGFVVVWRISRLFLSSSSQLSDRKRKYLHCQLVTATSQKRKVHRHEVDFGFRYGNFIRCNSFVSQGRIFDFSVLSAFIFVTFAQQAPDCVAIARQVPEDQKRNVVIAQYYHPHESDCNKYYQCAEYGLVLKSCPEDLHFDRNHYVCGWPHEINC